VVLWPSARKSNFREPQWPEVRDQLNSTLRGWANYFSYGSYTGAYRAVEYYVAGRVRHFLRRRHKVSSRGTQRFNFDAVFGQLGVVRLRRTPSESRA